MKSDTERRLEREILEIGDREKERLGRELHDGLCQTLAGIAALSLTLSRNLTTVSESGALAAGEISALLGAAIVEARDLSRGLGLAALKTSGLTAALADMARNIERRFRVPCAFACEPPPGEIPHETEAHLFRIAQQAVSNALAHGAPTRIAVGLTRLDGKGRLEIVDDGDGLPGGGTSPVGSGLDTMAYRARLIGGSLTVRKQVPRGTAVTCLF